MVIAIALMRQIYYVVGFFSIIIIMANEKKKETVCDKTQVNLQFYDAMLIVHAQWHGD